MKCSRVLWGPVNFIMRDTINVFYMARIVHIFECGFVKLNF